MSRHFINTYIDWSQSRRYLNTPE